MRVYTDLSEYKSKQKTFVTLGTFDGVHVGHQKVLQKLLKSARKSNAETVLLTFYPHPRIVLQKDIGIKLINTIEERIQLLEQSGLDVLIVQKFSTKFSKMSALDFVRKILVNKLNIDSLFIGYDHQFGKNREGNYKQLSDFGFTYSFKVKEISQQDISNIAVSSTKIRKALEKGNIEKANAYLGYHFMLTGNVVSGNNLGATLGFPTANIQINDANKLIPKQGAYVVKSTIAGKVVFGMMNIGNRPTIGGINESIEVNFFDIDADLYGQNLQIDILKFLREEIKFKNVDELKIQLIQDKENALNYLNGTFFDSDIKEL